jgi:excisionase family DNA binding protein
LYCSDGGLSAILLVVAVISQTKQKRNKMMKTKPEPEFFTIDEFAALFRRVPTTVRQWCAQNRIEYLRIGKALLIPRSEVTRVRREGVDLTADESNPKV